VFEATKSPIGGGDADLERQCLQPLREQDIHRIVDTFTRAQETARYARMVPFEKIADPKNAFNLNLPRYIDASEPEDLQDIEAHRKGGIPEKDIGALRAYWQVMPDVRAALFEAADRPRYQNIGLPIAEVRRSILDHAEFRAFTTQAAAIFTAWRARG